MSDEVKDDPAPTASPISWPREAPRFVALSEPWGIADDPAILSPLTSVGQADRAAWVDRLSKAKVQASRRNSPDLAGQLAQTLRRPIDTVLCGVLDVDPAACLNGALASQYPMELTAGVMLLGRITGARSVGVATDARVPSRWFSRLRRACSGVDLRVEPIINDYPQAEPTLLIYSMLGRRLRPGRLPTETGVLLFDAAAAIAVGRCALFNESMTSSPVVVRDRLGDHSHYAIASTGWTIADLFARFGMSSESRTLRAGDVLRDVRISPTSEVGAGELVIHVGPSEPAENPDSCIRCGWCADSCPTRVHPAGILEAAQLDDPEMAERSGLEACIECGICSYVCPSRLPLLVGIRQMLRKG